MAQQKPPLANRIRNHPLSLLLALACGSLITLGASLDVVQKILPTRTESAKKEPANEQARLVVSIRADPRLEVRDVDKNFSPVSFEEYVRRALPSANERSTELQRNEYVRSMKGKVVMWKGEVAAVAEKRGELLLTLRSTHRLAQFSFSQDHKTELLQLNTGDPVQVIGVLERTEPPMSIRLVRSTLMLPL